MIYGNPFVNAACAILIIGRFAALLICSPWVLCGVMADRRAKGLTAYSLLKGMFWVARKRLNN